MDELYLDPKKLYEFDCMQNASMDENQEEEVVEASDDLLTEEGVMMMGQPDEYACNQNNNE